jgi:hypothetical protein
VHVRYITRAGERHATKTRLYQALVELLHGRQANPSAAASAKGGTLEAGPGRIATSFRNILQQTLSGCVGQVGAVQDLAHHYRWQRA